MNNKKRFFNALPVEIIKEIFCNTSSQDLFNMKLVCSFWKQLIQEILTIKEIPKSAGKYSIDVFMNEAVFKLCRAPCGIHNLISEKIISDQIGCRLISIERNRFVDVFKLLRSSVKRPVLEQLMPQIEEDVSEIVQDVTENIVESKMQALWGAIIAMSGVSYSVDDCRLKTPKRREAVKSLAINSKWYMYIAESRTSDGVFNSILGIVVQYPDMQTFAILHGYDYETYDEYDYGDNDYDDSYDYYVD